MMALKWIGIGIAGAFVVSTIAGTIITLAALRVQQDLLDEQRQLNARMPT